jgi:hypothetical protein
VLKCVAGLVSSIAADAAGLVGQTNQERTGLVSFKIARVGPLLRRFGHDHFSQGDIYRVGRPRLRILGHCEIWWSFLVRYPLSKKGMASTSGTLFFVMQTLLNDTNVLQEIQEVEQTKSKTGKEQAG